MQAQPSMSTTSPWVAWTGWWGTSPIVQTATCASLTRAPSGSPSHPSGPRLCHTALLGACWRNWGPRRSMSPNWTTGDWLSLLLWPRCPPPVLISDGHLAEPFITSSYVNYIKLQREKKIPVYNIHYICCDIDVFRNDVCLAATVFGARL